MTINKYLLPKILIQKFTIVVYIGNRCYNSFMMNNILVIRYGTIGDTIFASAFYRELRKALPSARIDILVEKISYGVMEFCPYINNVHFINGKYKNILSYINLFKNYDTVYFLKNDSFFSLTAFLAGVKNRIGFDVRRNKFLTMKSPYKNDKHEIDCYLDLLKISNIQPISDNTELWTDKNNDLKVKTCLNNKAAKHVLIQAYSRFAQKNWIDDYWKKVITFLVNECNCQVYYAGGEKDCEFYNKINETFSDEMKIPPENLCGKFSISETMSFVKNMDLVIGIDSGIIHMAAALDIPSILLNGPTSLVRWKPRSSKCHVITKNFPCSPCLLESGKKELCKGMASKCMEAITDAEVIAAIKDILQVKK